MKISFFSLLQKLGQALMVPVSVLPAAGLIVALGRYLQMGTSMHFFSVILGKILYTSGLAIFEQLPVIFAIGVAIGFTGGAGVAGLSAAAGYFTLVNLLKVITEVRALPLAINTGVFGGILIGLLAASLYLRYHTIQLPKIFGFFSGKRFIPIVTVSGAVFIGIALGFLWPPIQEAINHFGILVTESPYGAAFYAAGKRFLIPVGLHHVYYPSFLFEFGQYVNAAGEMVRGDSTRYFAGDPTAGVFMASEFPIMLFGLPAAALAITLRAEPQRRRMIGSLMLTAALTSIITGITEPIEFAFIFVAPLLFIIHVTLAFVSGLLTTAFHIHLGYTFSASLIDFALGFFNQKNSVYLWLVVGPLVGLCYFTSFYVLIGLFDLKTPGREKVEEENIDTSKTMDRTAQVLAALGGKSNLIHIDACITRLRLTVNDTSLVQEKMLKKLGASGLMKAGNGNIQVIFGTESDRLKDEILKLVKDEKSVKILAPIEGTVITIDKVPDPVFAQKTLGDGCAIEPKSGLVVAPFDGEVVQLFHTNHAIGLIDKSGVELLVHIGINTVQMKGKGFKAFVRQGQMVKKGDPLIEFDIAEIRAAGKSIITPIVITNVQNFKGIRVEGTKVDRLSNFITIDL